MIEVIIPCDVCHVYDLSINLVLTLLDKTFLSVGEFYESNSFFLGDVAFSFVYKGY
jgi:hypothetical protein